MAQIFVEHFDPARVLADVAARRSILALHHEAPLSRGHCAECMGELPCRTVRLLGQAYADHPHFHPSWAIVTVDPAGMTADLVAFLRTRLDEDEQIALDASPGPWTANAEYDEVLAEDNIVVAEGFALSNSQLRRTVEHIARHDPARVLADVAAKRAILNAFEHKTESMARYPNPGNAGGLMAMDKVIKLLVEPYAGHPLFHPSWAVSEPAC